MKEQQWYAEFFGEDYLRLYASILSPQRTEREVTQIVERLGLARGSAILDLCCGHGRHAVALAERGHRVTGLDLSTFFLEKAKGGTHSSQIISGDD